MPFTVSDDERADLLCTYAALILHDDSAPITAENIQKLIEAAGGSDKIESYYPKLFASVLEGKDLTSILMGGGSGGSSSGSGSSSSGSSGSSGSSDSDSSSDSSDSD